MGLFKKSEEKREEKRRKKAKIEEFSKKCNFLSEDGECSLTSHGDVGYQYPCDFEACIFMKILKK